jgi:hypothetical protein
MAFKKPPVQVAVPESPDRLFRDLPRRKHPSLYDHQGQILRTYVLQAMDAPDVAYNYRRAAAKRWSACSWRNGVAVKIASALSIFAPPVSS